MSAPLVIGFIFRVRSRQIVGGIGDFIIFWLLCIVPDEIFELGDCLIDVFFSFLVMFF